MLQRCLSATRGSSQLSNSRHTPRSVSSKLLPDWKVNVVVLLQVQYVTFQSFFFMRKQIAGRPGITFTEVDTHLQSEPPVEALLWNWTQIRMKNWHVVFAAMVSWLEPTPLWSPDGASRIIFRLNIAMNVDRLKKYNVPIKAPVAAPWVHFILSDALKDQCIGLRGPIGRNGI